MDAITQQTLDIFNKTAEAMSPAELAKVGYTQNSTATAGLQGYNLERPAKQLYPVITPLRNEIPRVGGQFGVQANWKAVTGIDTTIEDPGVSEGNRVRAMSTTMTDYNAVFKGIAKEHKVTYEAEYAARGYDDLVARANMEALQALMISEEFLILGGNTTNTGNALGTANTPTGVLQTAVGTMTAQATVCAVVGLTMDGRRNSSVTGGVKLQYTRTNEDGSSDVIKPGHGIVSAASSAVTTASTNLGVTWTVVPKAGEVAWAWYTGPSGTLTLAAVTDVPQFAQLANAGGTQLASAADLGVDNSQNPLHFDGIITQLMKPGSGAYFVTVNGKLTADGGGGVAQISAALANRWDAVKTSTYDIWMGYQARLDTTSRVVGAGVANQNMRINVTSGPGQTDIQAGTIVGGIYNPITGELNRLRTHPNMPGGMILGIARGPLPYANNNIPNVWQVRTRQEYYSVEWPRVSRKYQLGVYADEVLQGYYPPANFIINGILPG
jgi:hypothetical protein